MPITDMREGRGPVRHIISLDGTWQTSDQENPTNIKLLYDSLADRGADGMPQRKVYFNGTATEGSWLRRIWNGVTGADLEDKIVQAYEYLSKNYKPGDDIVLMGFSRGGYTARSLNGMIYKSGLIKDGHKLSAEELHKKSHKAFKFYRNNVHPKDEEAKDFRTKNSYNDNPKVSLGIFETVGELGIPNQFNPFRAFTRWRYKFHDTTLNENTENAFHALGIDEKRMFFKITPMEPTKGAKTHIEEEYFAGDHSAVGGGSIENRQISDIPALWMAKKLENMVGVGYDDKKLADTFHPDPTANPFTDFDPEDKWWNVFGLYPRDIPETAKINSSVTARFAQVATYYPTQIASRLTSMLESNERQPDLKGYAPNVS